MVPFNLKIKGDFVPKTKYIFDYSYLSRVGYFDLNSLKFNYGYKWKKKLTNDHDLSVLSINYFNISNPSPNFYALINTNVLLKSRFEEQFIFGSAYSFSYNEQLTKPQKRNPLYFNGNIELTGNSLSLFSKGNITAENPSKVFGIIYAQYARLDIDVRKYFKFTENTMIASRFIAGWGLPYGNSLTMPYIKQFFSGGAYSLRGFQAFSLGPGSYRPADSSKNSFFLQQGGEIKLEANIEYRFPIMGMLKGVLFADAGNVWLNKSNSETPGGEFNSKYFLKELAINAGTGIRLDLNFFVLRLDVGIPLKKPWLPESDRWVNKFDASSIVYNIAFGYPF